MPKYCRTALVSLTLFFIITLQFSLACKIKEQPGGGGSSKPSAPLGKAQLQVHMLDVGQGDSLLIITPEKKYVLIDAGLAQAGDRVIAALEKYQVDHIDLAVATHPHADHIGGMPKVLNAITVKKF